jgi:type IV pilus assembly protein PilQ
MVLEKVDVALLKNLLRVEIETGGALSYSTSTSVEPPSVTIDLPGVSKGVDLRRIEVNKPPVLQVVPMETVAPRPGLQLVFLLSATAKPDIHIEGTKLVIEFPREEGAGLAPGDSSMAGPAAIMDGTSSTPQLAGKTDAVRISAQTVKRIEVQKGGGDATVLVVGDGEFLYEAKRIKSDRLVLDLLNVVSALKGPVIPVGHPLLKQIRVGRHSDKVRLVFDLPKASDYEVRPIEGALRIHLGKAKASTSVEPQHHDAHPAPTLVSKVVASAPLTPTEPAMDQAQTLVEVASEEHAEKAPRLAQLAPEKSLPDQEEVSRPRYVGRRISLDFQGADITNVLRLIADVSGFNIVVGEGVKAKITMKLVGVPWDQALEMLLKMNNLGMIREGNIVWIDTLANIARQQDEEARAKEAKNKAEDLVTRVIYVQNVPAAEIQLTLRQYLSSRGQLMANAASNALVIKDTETNLMAMTQLVRELDLEVPQVQIEARIVQADTTYARSLGVQWGVSRLNTLSDGRVLNFRGQGGGGSSGAISDSFGAQVSQFMVNLPATVSGLSSVPAAGFTFGMLDGSLLDLRLSAGEALGLTKVIAAPKITTLDKREAKIEQGEAIPYQTVSLQGTQTTFVDANLTLQVTPQITSRDPKEVGKQVLLKIRATRNAVGSRSNQAGPSIDKREATTQVLVRDGETMVIGGIFVDTQTNSVSGIPFFSRIPVIGWLFKSKTDTVAKQELLIFLTPTIVRS